MNELIYMIVKDFRKPLLSFELMNSEIPFIVERRTIKVLNNIPLESFII